MAITTSDCWGKLNILGQPCEFHVLAIQGSQVLKSFSFSPPGLFCTTAVVWIRNHGRDIILQGCMKMAAPPVHRPSNQEMTKALR
jgi:hypothetical protein